MWYRNAWNSCRWHTLAPCVGQEHTAKGDEVMKLVFICESTMHCYITILRDHIVMHEEYEKDGK
jgi:hypothetical protein